MEDRKTIQKSNQKKQHNADYYTRVTLLQTIVCLTLSLVCFAVSRGHGEAAEHLRDDFSNLMQWEITADDVRDVWSLVRDKLETAEVIGSAAVSTTLSDVSSAAQEETQASEAVESQLEETAVSSKSDAKKAAGRKDSETRTTAPTVEDGAGGEDVTAVEATQTAAVSVSAMQRIVRPVQGGRYSSRFGYRTNPITHVYSFHTGLDIAVPQGTEIVAAYRGRVDRVGRDARAGKYIVLSHGNGYETVYCHCSRILAEEGDSIRAGDSIALVGSTGWSTGPHLHFEIRKDGERLDPYPILEHEV